jgi:hypothetical protein
MSKPLVLLTDRSNDWLNLMIKLLLESLAHILDIKRWGFERSTLGLKNFGIKSNTY